MPGEARPAHLTLSFPGLERICSENISPKRRFKQSKEPLI